MHMLTVYISHARLSFCSQLTHKKKENIVQEGPKVRPHVQEICAASCGHLRWQLNPKSFQSTF